MAEGGLRIFFRIRVSRLAILFLGKQGLQAVRDFIAQGVVADRLAKAILFTEAADGDDGNAHRKS